MFIIVAIIVVALAALFYAISPRLGIDLSLSTKNPENFIETCLEDDLEEIVEQISLQGGSLDPPNYFVYNNQRIEYLCYTNKDVGQTDSPECIVQQPLLKQHIESEIKEGIQDLADICFNALKNDFEKKGFVVKLTPGETKVELLPERIITTFGHEVVLTKDSSEKYNEFDIILKSNLFELVSIANSIINSEVVFGDTDTLRYIMLYRWLNVKKDLQDDGTRIYLIENVNSGDKFQFASRSFVWPSGFV